MSEAEALHRAWVIFGFGLLFLALTGLQLWTGKTLQTGPQIVPRETHPISYWLNVVLSFALSLFALGMAVSRIIATGLT